VSQPRVAPGTLFTDVGGRLTREGFRYLEPLNGEAPFIFPEYTIATLPSASRYENGVIIVSNETGGRTLATSDGTNWRRVSDGAIVS
jgi:hypothetical protein